MRPDESVLESLESCGSDASTFGGTVDSGSFSGYGPFTLNRMLPGLSSLISSLVPEFLRFARDLSRQGAASRRRRQFLGPGPNRPRNVSYKPDATSPGSSGMIWATKSMRRALLTVSVAVSLSSPIWFSRGAILHAADDLVLTRFSEYLDSLRTQAGIPGLTATIVGPSDVQWERAFGQQDIERSISTLPDTAFHLDAVTQIFTATMILRCVEEGRLSLDERIGTYVPNASEPGATLRQLLTHTSGPPDNLVFSYRPARLDVLASAVSICTGDSFRTVTGAMLERAVMFDSTPGPDVLQVSPPPFPSSTMDRYRSALGRLATPYSVDSQGRASQSRYAATTLTASTGLVSTVRDVAKFDLALKRGTVLRSDTVARAWTAPVGRLGQAMPHGLGWFVQGYSGEPVVWQFGIGDNGSSSMVITLPRRGLTLIMLANSDGLVKHFPLAAGDLTVSPFGRLFLGVFVR